VATFYYSSDMQVISWNVNGLRAMEGRGFVEWTQEITSDFLCLQEIKLQEAQLTDSLREVEGYNSYFHCASKKGYSGVAVYAKAEPITVTKTIGLERFDDEGRFLQLEYDTFYLINVYLPHGSRTQVHMAYKLECYQAFSDHLRSLGKPVVIVGDLNVARTELDLARPKQNQKSTMFTPDERQALTRLLDIGLVDAFRHLHPNERQYTWWPWLKTARANNVGWRIDYALISKELLPALESATILRERGGSDHCPIQLTVGLEKFGYAPGELPAGF